MEPEVKKRLQMVLCHQLYAAADIVTHGAQVRATMEQVEMEAERLLTVLGIDALVKENAALFEALATKAQRWQNRPVYTCAECPHADRLIAERYHGKAN